MPRITGTIPWSVVRNGASFCRHCGRTSHAKPRAGCPPQHFKSYERSLASYRKYRTKYLEKERIRNKQPQMIVLKHNSRLRQQYGITQEQYMELLARQGGGCGICGSKDPQRRGTIFFLVDHNHSTGELRGLLCYKCNTSIGYFKDSPEIIQKALDYLVKPPLLDVRLGSKVLPS